MPITSFLRRRGALLALALLVILAAYPAERALAVVRGWRALRRDLPPALAALRAPDGSGAAALSAARRDVERLEAPLEVWRSLIAPWAEPLSQQRSWPRLAHWATLADEGSAAALDLCRAAWWTLLAAQSVAEQSGQTTQATGVPLELRETPLAAALRALAEESDRLLAARTSLERAAQAWEVVSSDRDRDSSSGQALQAAPFALDMALLAAEWLADGQPHRALLLVQNSDELRPTGGFISAVVVVDVQAGATTSLRYLSSDELESYAAAHPAPPDPLRRLMGAGVLLLRDGNWSPHFPTTAEVVTALYALETGQDVDLVIAIDTATVYGLLTAFGPLFLPFYNVTVSAKDFTETAAVFWQQPLHAPALGESQAGFQEWLAHRKDFGGALLQALEERLADLDPAGAMRLLGALAHSARTRDLLVWAPARPHLQAHLRRAGLDGGLRNTEGDYLMVVDANVGWNKADRHITRRIDYAVSLEPEGPRARLVLTYQHTAESSVNACVHRARYLDSYQALTEQCYWAYTRVLTPVGSTLLAVDGAIRPPDVTVEEGKTGFGLSLVVPPGETRTLTIEYRLPATVLSGPAYRLLVQRQPGSGATAVRIALDGLAATIDPGLPWEALSQGSYATEGLLETDLEWLLPLDATP
ncbi:MAG: DUF4012 domain-containing protein [Anaerolineae bacterium]